MVYIFLADGFEEIEALTQIDYLRRAGVDIISVGITDGDGGVKDTKLIMGAHGIPVVADICACEAIASEELEMVILPGGLGGVDGMKKSPKVAELVDYCVKNDKFVAAICAAPTILAQMGLLDGKRATCYPAMKNELNGCLAVGGRVIRDGKIITAAAAGVSEEFSFELISVLKGGETAHKVRESICAR